MHIPSLVKTPWQLLKLLSRNENMGVSWADNSVKIWQNLSISNPKPDLYNINAHTKFGENPLTFTQFFIRKRKLGVSQADNSLKIWRNLPISNPKTDLHNINAHTKFGENPLMFTQVIIWTQNTDGQTYGGWADRHTDIQHETILPSHYRVARNKTPDKGTEYEKTTPLTIFNGKYVIGAISIWVGHKSHCNHWMISSVQCVARK